jgi:hypothetical protein
MYICLQLVDMASKLEHLFLHMCRIKINIFGLLNFIIANFVSQCKAHTVVGKLLSTCIAR